MIGSNPLLRRIEKLRVNFDVLNPSIDNEYLARIFEAKAQSVGISPSEEDEATGVLIKNLDKTLNGGESCVLNKRVKERLLIEMKDKKDKTLMKFTQMVQRVLREFRQTTSSLTGILDLKYLTSTSSGVDRKADNKKRKSYDKETVVATQKKTCYTCGRPGHEGGSSCWSWNHPNANKDPNVSFRESKFGKIFNENIKKKDSKVLDLKMDGKVLPTRHDVYGNPWTGFVERVKPQGSSDKKKQKTQKRKGNDMYSSIQSYLNAFKASERVLVPCTIFNDINSINVNVLIDTGALQDNYISEDVAELLKRSTDKDLNFDNNFTCKLSLTDRELITNINLGGTSNVVSTLGKEIFNLKFLNEINLQYEILPCITANIFRERI